MKHVFAAVLYFVLVSSFIFCDGLVSVQEVAFRTVDSGESRLLLVEDDLYIKNLTVSEISLKLRTSKDITLDEYKRYVASQALDWTEDEKKMIRTIVVNLKKALESYDLKFPKEVLLILTTGNEEGKSAYCRDNIIIVIPKNYIALGMEELQNIILHELFHIFSRNNPELQEKLYGAIGFIKTNNLCDLPARIEQSRVTNPDAILMNYYFPAKIGNEDYKVMPILLVKSRYNERQGGFFFDYLSLYFIAVDVLGDKTVPIFADNAVLIFPLSKISNYFAMVGENTDYIIHPEEILADNFVLLITRAQNVKTHFLLEKMKELLN